MSWWGFRSHTASGSANLLQQWRVVLMGTCLALGGMTAAPHVTASQVTVSQGHTKNQTQMAAFSLSLPTYVSQIYNPGGVPPLSPNATALANNGTLYASDEEGQRIVTVDPSNGVVTTLSPTSVGWSHPSGLYLEADQSHMLVADKDHNRIVEVALADGSITRAWGGGPGAVDAGLFNSPEDMTMDGAGNIFVNDTYNYRVVAIRAVDGQVLWTQPQSSPTGSGPGCDGSPLLRNRGLTLGSDGNLYVSDTDQGRVVELDPATGSCLAVLGGRHSSLGVLQEPRGIDSDRAGGLWIAENRAGRIRHITLSGANSWVSPTTFGSATCPTACQFRSPHGVQFIPGATPGTGSIYVSDTYNYRITVYSQTPDGSGTAAFNSYIAEPFPVEGGFAGPFGVAYDPSGNLYVADHYNSRVEEFDPSGAFAGQVGGEGTPLGSFNFPRGVTVLPSTSTMWAGDVVVGDSENNRLQIFAPASFAGDAYGTPPVAALVPTGSRFLRPQQISVSPLDGSLWIADTNNGKILNLDLHGTVLHSWTAQGNTRPAGVVVDASGNVYVAGKTIAAYSPTGALERVVAPSGTAPGDVRGADGMAISNSSVLYVADTLNNRVDEFDLSTQQSASFGTVGSGNGQLNQPCMVAVGPTGQIAVTDFGNNRVSLWQS